MGYQPDPDFKEPGDNTIVWRYMSFSKFVSMLRSQALYFGSAERMSDPYEGSIPFLNRTIDVEEAAAARGVPTGVMAFHLGLERKQSLAMPSTTFLNCWHMNNGESAGMWAQYLKNDEGIAIKSTVARLKEGLDWHEYHPIHIGMVNYIDYSTYRLAHPNRFLLPFLHKRLSFEHEKELRAVIYHSPDPRLDPTGRGDIFNPHIPCNLALD